MRTYERILDAINGISKSAAKDEGFICHLILMMILCYISKFSQVFPHALIAISIELLNTSIENLCDKVCKDICEEIKTIKDISAGASFIAQLNVLYISVTNLK